jgi:peptidoglycan/xylan/chitin deacetylase (PgdA/CDA1 family)
VASLLFRTFSPAGASARLSIFIFHRVLPAADPLLPFEPSVEQFDWMVRLISRNFNVLPLSAAARRLQAGTLPTAAAAITFDDGYADNFEMAWPILAHYGIPATFFIATAFLDGGRMWNDEVIEAFRKVPEGELNLHQFDLGSHQLHDTASRIRGYEAVLGKLKYFEHVHRAEVARAISRQATVPARGELMMSRSQLRQLRAAGAEIGAHTHTHPILEGLTDEQALAEIAAGKLEVESILGETVTVFAYPNGVPGRDYSARHGKMVERLGFSAAVSTQPRFANAQADRFQLPRFTPWDRTPQRFALRCMWQLWNSRRR